MSWVSVGKFDIAAAWVFSSPVMAEIFRISHVAVSTANTDSLFGAIAQCFTDTDGSVTVFSPRKLVWREEKENFNYFNFYFPVGVALPEIGFQRLDTTGIEWAVNLEYWQDDNSETEISNYLSTRFGETAIMDYLVSRPLTFRSLNPVTWQGSSGNIGANNAISASLLVAANPNRAALVVRATGTANLQLFSDSAATNLIETVPAGQIFLLPNSSDIYQGTIYSQPSSATGNGVSYTEYS